MEREKLAVKMGIGAPPQPVIASKSGGKLWCMLEFAEFIIKMLIKLVHALESIYKAMRRYQNLNFSC